MRSEVQGIVAVNAVTLAVIDETEIAKQNPDLLPGSGDSGFDTSRALPFYSINGTRYDLSEDTLALRPSPYSFPVARAIDSEKSPEDIRTLYSCDGGSLAQSYRTEITDTPGQSHLRITRISQIGSQIVLNATVRADRIAGFCLDADGSVFVVFATGSTFPEYAWQRFDHRTNRPATL